MTVDPGSGFLLEAQVAQYLRSEIRSGALPAGQAMPSEGELAARLRVSKEALRRGISLLVAEGLIGRRQGALSKVADPVPPMRQIRVGPGAVIGVRVPLGGEGEQAGAGRGAPLIAVTEPGQATRFYPGDRAEVVVED